MILSPSQRGADWLVGLMNDDGSMRGGASINEYYKTVFGLACAGRHAEADRMLDYVAKRFLRNDGGLDGAACEWFHLFHAYPHAWVQMAALMRGRLDLVHRLNRYMLSFQDEQTGGFYPTPEQRQQGGEQDMMSTGVVAIALLWAGQLEAAQRTGQWFRKVWEAQPDVSKRLCFVWPHQRGLMTDYADAESKSYAVDARKNTQRYYQFGIACALLTQLGAATGEGHWHELASRYLHASRHYNTDVYQRPQSGKIGWGAAWRYRLLRDAADLPIIRQVHDHLAAGQSTEGWWAAPNVYAAGQGPAAPAPSIDLTAEFVAHFHWMEAALASASGETPR